MKPRRAKTKKSLLEETVQNGEEKPADWLPEKEPDEAKPQADLSDVPTSLEGLLTGEEGKNAHQILGTLVEADAKEVEAILGRTIIKDPRFVGIINRALHLARTGIGGPHLTIPKPWMSRYILDFVRTLPSVGGESREQLVRGFQSSEEVLRRHEELERRKKESMGHS